MQVAVVAVVDDKFSGNSFVVVVDDDDVVEVEFSKVHVLVRVS